MWSIPLKLFSGLFLRPILYCAGDVLVMYAFLLCALDLVFAIVGDFQDPFTAACVRIVARVFAIAYPLRPFHAVSSMRKPYFSVLYRTIRTIWCEISLSLSSSAKGASIGFAQFPHRSFRFFLWTVALVCGRRPHCRLLRWPRRSSMRSFWYPGDLPRPIHAIGVNPGDVAFCNRIFPPYMVPLRWFRIPEW